MGLIGRPKISVTNYQPTLHTVPEERRPQLRYDRNLKSHITHTFSTHLRSSCGPSTCLPSTATNYHLYSGLHSFVHTLLSLCFQVVITVDGGEIFTVGIMGSRLLSWAPTAYVNTLPNLISCVAYQTVEICLPNLSLIFVCHTLVRIQTSDKVYRNVYHKMATGSHFSMQFYDSYHIKISCRVKKI